MRIKSKIITIEYAGAAILSPGGHISGQDFGLNRSFTTSADSLLDAASPAIRAYGNAQGACEFAVAIDFDTEEEAFSEALERTAFVEAHQTGTLKMTVGSKLQAWQAGISGTDCKLSYTPDSVRLIFSYSFILGAAV